jgi:phage tail protein X
MNNMQAIRSIEGDTVDLICWRYYHHTIDVTEQVLTANPHLSVLGPILPNGTIVWLPEQPSPQPLPLIQLWD